MKTAVISVTKSGKILAKRISAALEDCTCSTGQGGVGERLRQVWRQAEEIICIMAAGIVVRSLAPLCEDKRSDPCVVVLDEKGKFVISLLSGHLGGGNALARKVARITGGTAVITTASDVSGHTAIDLWMAGNNLVAANPERLTSISARLINEGTLAYFSDQDLDCLPSDFCRVEKIDQADVVISPLCPDRYHTLWMVPGNLFVGFGCNRGTTSAEFEQALDDMCRRHRIDPRAIVGLASIDLKSDEKGLLDLAKKHHFPLSFFSKDELNSVAGISVSEASIKATGAKGVAEPAAMLAAARDCVPGRLFVRKMKWKNITAAVAARKIPLKG